MAYQCRIYIKSGFNSCNIPDSPALLDTVEYVDVPALDILQQRCLNTIKVKATWSQIRNADYLRLYTSDNWGWYYSIENITMLATDVAQFAVVPDYINSIGGVSKLEILDGITERVHVTDDGFGMYTESDSLMTPTEPLQLVSVWVDVGKTGNTYVESTIALPETGFITTGRTYTDTDTETGESVSCVVPAIASIGTNATDFTVGSITSMSPNTVVYNMDDVRYGEIGDESAFNVAETTRYGIDRARALGVESSILKQVQIPTVFVTPSYDEVESLLSTDNTQFGASAYVHTMTGNWSSVNIDIPYSYTGADNNRLNYGEFTKYGIITTSSESCEFNPEDIYESGGTPTLRMVGDPRLDGKPYFRFATVNGDSSDRGFFRNCVAGLQWKSVPLIFTEASGTALNTLRYENSKNVSSINYSYNQSQGELTQLTNMVGGMSNVVGNLLTGNLAGAVTSATSTVTNAFSSSLQLEQNTAVTNATRQNELAELEIANTVTVPTVNFPLNAEFMRDFYGNGCLVYRYEYNSNDISRIDKLLTMYGYRFSKPLTKADFSNRKYFNFVKCGNATFGGFNKWINNGLHEQLSNGVRVWHVLPDNRYYTNNPVEG